MHSMIALLRAVNVGGRNRLPMTDLRNVAADLRFNAVQTYVQSGNLVFATDRADLLQIEAQLRTAIFEKSGVETDVFLRSSEEWQLAIRQNPFEAFAQSDPSRFAVVFLTQSPEEDAVAKLKASVKGNESIEVVGRHAYVCYPDGMGNSKLPIGVMEAKLAVRGTARNWNTVLQLLNMAQG